MHGAAYALLANVAVAAMFAASFALIGLTQRQHRSAFWFSASYLLGMLTPLSEFLLPLSPWPGAFAITSHSTLSAALLLMTAALCAFYKRPVPARTLAILFLLGLAARLSVWNVPRETLLFNATYQAPFAVAALASAVAIWRHGSRRPLEIGLTTTFVLFALHFLAKSAIALRLGAGRTAQDYVTSTYALVSQATSGVLLIALGLLTLLLVVQAVLADAVRAADTDALSGLANRRGFDRHAQELMIRMQRTSGTAAILLVDIDHFKHINDRHGHAVGDSVIAHLGSLLQGLLPANTIIGRIGGEEFAALVPAATSAMARLAAETIRTVVASGPPSLPAHTVSIGVAVATSIDTLADAMRRADRALYRAKSQGRNRVCVADPDQRETRLTA